MVLIIMVIVKCSINVKPIMSLTLAIYSKELTDDNEICSEKNINIFPQCDNNSVISIL